MFLLQFSANYILLTPQLGPQRVFFDLRETGASSEPSDPLSKPSSHSQVSGKQNATYKQNFQSLEKLVLVMAEDDTMVHPKESEHFGYFKDGSRAMVVTLVGFSAGFLVILVASAGCFRMF